MSEAEDKAHPVDLTVDKTAREFRVEWAGGEKSAYGFDYLAAFVRARIAGRSARRARKTPSPSSRGRAGRQNLKMWRWWGATPSISSGGAVAARASIRLTISTRSLLSARRAQAKGRRKSCRLVHRKPRMRSIKLNRSKKPAPREWAAGSAPWRGFSCG